MPRLQKQARHKLAPVATRQFLETEEQKVGQDKPRDMPVRGKARIEPAHIEPVEGPVSKDKLDALAFNEDEITVLVHESTNPTDEPFPEVWNGGKVQRFMRGEEQKVKRKYVEVLARAKKTVYTQQRYKDGAGNDSIRNVPHTALRYPFSITHDPSPKGAAWLKSVLAQA